MGNLTSGNLKRSRTTSSDDEPPNKERNVDQNGVGIDDLPDEIICMILSYSSSMELINNTQNVCRRWKRLSHDPELWRGRFICIRYSCSEQEAVSALRNLPQVRTLHLSNEVTPPVLEAVSSNCPRITTLTILRCYQITRSLLQNLVMKCRNIQAITVPHRLLFYERRARCLSQMNELRSLEIDEDIGTEKQQKHVNFRPLAEGCPALHELEISSTDTFQVRGLAYFFSRKSSRLTHLKLPWAVHTCNHRWCVLPLLEDCRALRYLKLNHCHLLNNECSEVLPLLGRLSSLRTLILQNLRGTSEETARAFESGGLSCLQELEICDSDLGDRVVQAVCTHCAQLTSLTLTACYDITDDSLHHLRRLTRLNTLCLGICLRLGGDALSHVSQVSTLRELRLRGFKMSLLEPGLDRIAHLPALELLSFINTDLSTFPFHRLLGRLIHLRVLELDSRSVEEGELDRLREQMPHLRICRGRCFSDDWEMLGKEETPRIPQYSDTEESDPGDEEGDAQGEHWH